MPWNNPIVAGEELVLNSIHSPGFTSGSVGWTIKRDGSAEFNDVLMRGSLIVDGSVLFDADDALILEDNAGHPVIVLSRVDGSHNGHAYKAGVWHGWWEDPFTPDSVMQGYVRIINSYIEFNTDTDTSTTVFEGLNEDGFLRLLYDEITEIATFRFNSGSNNTGLDPNSWIDLNSRSVDGVTPPGIEMHGNVDIDADLTVADDLFVTDDVTINGGLSVGTNATFSGNTTIDGIGGIGSNEVYGSTVVNAGGGVVVGNAVSWASLAGAGTIRGFVTSNSASANLKNASISGLSATGATINVLRDGANVNTTTYYHIRREA